MGWALADGAGEVCCVRKDKRDVINATAAVPFNVTEQLPILCFILQQISHSVTFPRSALHRFLATKCALKRLAAFRFASRTTANRGVLPINAESCFCCIHSGI
jgi:hypothetical protein